MRTDGSASENRLSGVLQCNETDEDIQMKSQEFIIWGVLMDNIQLVRDSACESFVCDWHLQMVFLPPLRR